MFRYVKWKPKHLLFLENEKIFDDMQDKGKERVFTVSTQGWD